MKKLSDTIVQELNNEGLGGRLVYVPLRKKTVSDTIYQTMLSMLKAGRLIDFDQFQNVVSLRTLYRIRAKAARDYELLKNREDGAQDAM